MNVILTTYQGAILGPIARVLGYILQALYALLANFGIENTGIYIFSKWLDDAYANQTAEIF